MRFGRLRLWMLLSIQLILVLAWQCSARPISQQGNGERFDLSLAVSSGRSSTFDNLAIPITPVRRSTKVSNKGKNNTTVEIVDSNGDDIWDGEITNEDMRDILNDRFGLLAVMLGSLAIILLCLIILTLTLAYWTEKSQERAYKELRDAE